MRNSMFFKLDFDKVALGLRLGFFNCRLGISAFGDTYAHFASAVSDNHRDSKAKTLTASGNPGYSSNI